MSFKCPHCNKPLKLSDLELKCTRCGHTWIPRSDVIPKVCPNPKCKSPYWNRERIRKKEEVKK